MATCAAPAPDAITSNLPIFEDLFLEGSPMPMAPKKKEHPAPEPAPAAGNLNEELEAELKARKLTSIVKLAEDLCDMDVECLSTGYPQLDAILHPALGPVLEEFLFRGYLVRLLLWMLKVWTHKNVTVSVVVVLISSVAFGAIHLLRPGTTWTAVAIISGVGTIYGPIRMASGSSGTAAVAHAVYNVTLHIGMAVSR